MRVETFGKLFGRRVDGDLYAQPLYVEALDLPSGPRNVVVLATEHNTVFAYDADAPGAVEPIWRTSIGLATPLPNPYFGTSRDPAACRGEGYNLREVGITSTPVIDRATNTIYVVGLVQDPTATVPGSTCVDRDPSVPNYCESYACAAPVFRLELHALDLRTGAELPQSPATIDGSVAGTGAGSVGGMLRFDPKLGLQRPGLLLANGNVYIATASFADLGDYHGWVFAYDAATLTRTAAFVPTPDGRAGGIWQSGHALVADDQGFVYAVTGNGTFNGNRGGRDFGDTVLKLSPTLELVDWFSPILSDYQGHNYLDEWDVDLGSAAPVLIPRSNRLVVGGKQGIAYVLDRGNLGHFEGDDAGSVPRFRATWRAQKLTCDDRVPDSNIHGTPVVWDGPNGATLFVAGEEDYVKAYGVEGGQVDTLEGTCFCDSGPFPIDPPCGAPQSVSSDPSPGFMPGGVVALSANGKKPGTGIVWVSHQYGDGNATAGVVRGVLEAYDASDLSRRLWDSRENEGRDDIGHMAKFTPPMIANGKVYMATFSGELAVYGLLGE